MSRVIKFRAWRPAREVMLPWEEIVQEWPEHIAEIISGELFYAMQFTGFKDSNGVEIYEGDILQPKAYAKSRLARPPVAFHNGFFCLDLSPPYITARRPLHHSLMDAKRAGNDYAIIGNIYENPELLEATHVDN